MQAIGALRSARMLSLWRQRPFYLHIQVLFTALILVVGGVLIWSSYVQGRNIVLSAAEDVFERIERESAAEILRLRAPVEAVVEWISRAPITDAATLDARLQSLPALVSVLDRQAKLESIYVGYYNGDFFLVRALRTEADRKRFDAPRHAAFRVQSIERGDGNRMQFILFDAALNEIARTPAPADYSFDPRARPWYRDSMKSTAVIQTEPYVFFTTGDVGQTIAQRAEHGRAVVGADLTLKQLSATLAQARPTPSSELAIFDADKNVVAYSQPERIAANAAGNTALTKVEALSPVLAAAASDVRRYAARRTIDVEGRPWVVRALPTSAQGTQKDAWLAIAVPTDELLVAARAVLQRHVWLTLVLIALTVPFTWWVSRRIADNLNALTGEAAAIRRFDFTTPAPLRTRIDEIQALGQAMSQMRQTIRRFLDIAKALSAERNLDRLVERVLAEAQAAAGAQGGIVYLLDDDGRTLEPVAQAWRTPASVPRAQPPQLSLGDIANPIAHAAAQTVPHSQIVATQRPKGLEFLTTHFGAVPLMMVTVPLVNRSNTVIGIVCVFAAGTIEPPSPERMALVEAFAGAGALAIDNQRLLAAQKALLDALIHLVAGAIDAKSPYTGGHCERVPELTNMLTRAACDAKTGPFSEFTLDEDGWEALKIAGGLHDCGKVTTPEYVVDKATKLETIYDRIHEVRMRFEVLKRDAEIAHLKAIAAGGDAAALGAALERELDALDEDFAFVASSNTGGEYLAPESAQRLKEIAKRTWRRTLDDRLGISWEEAQRKARTAAPALPVTENLLADKPEHVFERGPRDLMPKDNPWGFRLETPASLYNRGEVYNLTVSRGTLTDEERYKINDHIVQTIVMLSRLPFPRHLKSVPELAGGHHEKMDGTGYPKRLHKNDMSVPARIMAIADIFEALTASDRPYKKGKKLSEAIRIMSLMKKDRHIDPELFELFLTSGVYLEYAKRFLKPEFIDEVDLGQYLGQPAAA